MKNFITKPLQRNWAEPQMDCLIPAPGINKNISTSTEKWKWMMAVITTVTLMFGLEKQANATGYTWAGGSSGAWTTNANWTPNTGYPGSAGNTDTAIFANGTYSISAVPSKTIALLQISNAGGNANVNLTPTATATLIAKNFTVASGCSVTIATGLTVAISGTSTFSNSGTVSGPGTIEFRSTATFPSGTGSGGAFGTTQPNVTLTGINFTVTLDGSTGVANLTIGNTTGLVLNNYAITVNGTFSNSASNNGYGLVGPGIIVFNAANSFPAGAGNRGIFSTNSTVYPSVTIANGIVVTNTVSTSIGTLTVNNSGSLTIDNGSTLTLTGTLSNSGTIQGQTNPTGIIQFNVPTSFPQGAGSGGTFSGTYPLKVTVDGAITVAADANDTINALTINNASGILNDGGNTITVLGAIANNGRHNSSTGGSITLTGSTAGHLLSGGGSYGNLTLNDARGATPSANTIVNGALILSNGIMSPASDGDTVFISPTGSVSSSGGWVNGFLAQYYASSGSAISKTFEVGDNTSNYRPVTVTFTSVSTPGYLIVSNTTGTFNLVPVPASITQDVAAYWTIIDHSITYPTATVAFNYQPGDISGVQSKFVAETYVFDNQNTNYGSWLSDWTSTNPTGTSTWASGVTTFGDFIIGDTINIPVQITAAGQLTLCQPGSLVLHSSVNIPGTYTYNWYQNSSSLNYHGVNDTVYASGLYYLQIKNTLNNNLYYSDSLLVTVNLLPTVDSGSALPVICPGVTTPALGGSFGGGATAALWSDGGAGGTFTNNGGLTPNTTTYTSSLSASSPVTLTLTTSGGSCGTAMASKVLTLKPLPASPGLYYDPPARICGGVPVLITDTSSGAYNYQWMFNGSPIAGANTKQYSADSAGVYLMSVTDPVTGCSNISSSIAVDRMPYIEQDSIFLPCTYSNDTVISMTNPLLFSYSTLPAACNVDMSNASIITTTTPTTGGALTWIICQGGNVIDSFTGSNVFVVEPGGVLNGYGGSGSNTAYIKAGGTFNYTGNGTPGANTVYYEPGAIISANMGAYTVIECTNIGVIYPADIALCVPFTYLWSTGDTTPSISVNPPLSTTYYVTVSEGNYSCTDSVVVIKIASSGTISAIPNNICQGSSSVLTVSGTSGPIQWQSSDSTTGFNDIPGAISTTDTSTPSQTTYFRVYTPNATSGCLDTTAIYKLSVNPPPSPPAITAANDSICSGDSTQVCAQGTFSGYLWNTGDTTVCTSALNAGGYWVSVTASDGCSNVSTHKEIYVYPVPSVSILAQGDTLSSFGAVGYQWFLNGNIINGATASFYVARQSGNYSVEIIDSYGCEAVSSPVTIAITDVNDLLPDMYFEVYPNPASGEIQIKVGSEWIGNEYELYDVCGKVVTGGIARNEKTIIDIAAMARGVYFVKMNGIVRKFMKL